MTLQSSPLEAARPTVVLEYTSMVIGTREQIEKAHGAFEALAKDFYDQCKEIGVQLQGAQGVVRPLTREESIHLVPRKFHMERDNAHICPVPFVSRNQLTKDRAKVTCKLCVKKLREEDERLEAGGGKAQGRQERPGP